MLALVAAAAACAAPAATARRSELLRSGFASRSGELLHYLGYPVNVVAGPALTPDRVVWAEQRAPGIWHVLEAPLRGAARPVRSTAYQPHARPFPSDLVLAASARRVTVGDLAFTCPPGSCRGSGLSHLASWRFGDPPSVVESCSARGCPAICTLAYPPGAAGDWIAYAGGCRSGSSPVVVRDLSPGGSRFRIPARTTAVAVHMAGRFVAYTDVGSDFQAVVYDRIARREMLRVDRAGVLAVQRDGTVVFYGNGSRIGWASPSAPKPHWIAPPPRGFGEVAGLARDRIAMVRNADRPYQGIQVVVIDLHGRVLVRRTIRRFLGQVAFDVAFDGRRVAYATQSCQTTAVTVWDIRDALPPVESHRPCPAAGAAARTAVVTQARRIRVSLRCPEYHRLGCAGRLHLVAYGGGEYSVVGTRTYNIPFGRRRGVSLRIRPATRDFLAAHPGAHVFGTTRAVQRQSVIPLEGPVRTRDFVMRVTRRPG